MARELAAPQGGVVHRRELRRAGITRDEVRSEVRGGRWVVLRRHTVCTDTAVLGSPGRTERGEPALQRPRTWPACAAWAVWESGSGAMLDGVSALRAAGLENYAEQQVFVTVPRGSHSVRLPGVRLHKHRVLVPGRLAGIPRVRTEAAAINAGQWAVSDRQAALIVLMTVQQGLTTGPRLVAELERRGRVRRRSFLRALLREVVGGVQALGELDFARLCRAYGIPEPTRQTARTGPGGRIYLDVWWEELGVGIEIDGSQHRSGLTPIQDALRDNEVRMNEGPILRIPSLGLLVAPAEFMRQVKAVIERAASARSRSTGHQ